MGNCILMRRIIRYPLMNPSSLSFDLFDYILGDEERLKLGDNRILTLV